MDSVARARREPHENQRASGLIGDKMSRHIVPFCAFLETKPARSAGVRSRRLTSSGGRPNARHHLRNAGSCM
jgi:hypothetical protein